MKANHQQFKGNKNSGRHPASIEKKFWDKLDGALPKAIDFCLDVIQNTKLNLLNTNLKQREVIELQNVGLKAAQILMSKAPQRLEGGGNEGEFIFKVIGNDYKI